MALIYTEEYYREQERIEQERRFKFYFRMIYVQLILLFVALNLHEINNSIHLISKNSVESNFNTVNTQFVSLPINSVNSSVGYLNYDLIDNFSDDHHQTGRTIIDVTIAKLNNHNIKYRCSFYNLDSSKNELSNNEATYYLNCW